jgi:hypothetical protein
MAQIDTNYTMSYNAAMNEFNSLDDWAVVNQHIRNNIRWLHNQSNRRQLYQMHNNLYSSVTELSKTEIDFRRTGNSVRYLAQLAKCKQELQELQQWITFATLLDQKPKQ